MIRFMISMLLLILTACNTTQPKPSTIDPPRVKWIVIEKTDEFTDITTTTVTVGTLYTRKGVYDYSFSLYPYISHKSTGEIQVGVRCGGKAKIPVGAVQIRIDNNPTWTITPAETPLDETSRQAMNPYQTQDPNVNQAIRTMQASMSPYTACTGEKALAIIGQMAQGHILKYRSSATANIQGSTGTYQLDQSFREAIQKLNILHLIPIDDHSI